MKLNSGDKLLIKNATLQNGDICDLKIVDGYIASIETNVADSSHTHIIDANSKMILPQFIDLNSRVKDNKISIANVNDLYRKSITGGVGFILLMFDNVPSMDNEIVIELINSMNRLGVFCIVNSVDINGNMSNISITHSLGAKGIYLQSNLGANIIDKIAKYSKMLDVPIFVNAYDGMGGLINYGEISFELGLESRHPLSEIKEVAKIIEVAIFYDIEVVFCAISEPRSIDLINEAKKINPNIFVEVSIHHLTLNDSECKNYNTMAKINPPLKDEEHREKLMLALVDNKIDLLTSLQCEVSLVNKELVFNEAAFGLDSIEYYFGILFTTLIRTNIISLDRLLSLCVYNPAKILNLNYGFIEAGQLAKLMIVDLEKSYVVNNHNSLFHGKEYYGVVEKLI